VPSQVAVPFAGIGQGVQRDPQVPTSESEAHVTPQGWSPAPHGLAVQRPSLHTSSAPHTTPHCPQWLRSVARSAHAPPHGV
jgi:hypothetical protein